MESPIPQPTPEPPHDPTPAPIGDPPPRTDPRASLFHLHRSDMDLGFALTPWRWRIIDDH
jgi:hypothetical protein